MIGPTNLNPLALSAFEISSASGVTGGTSSCRSHAFWIGAPPTKLQIHAEKSWPDSTQLKIGTGIVNCRVDFDLGAHDAGVAQQPANIAFVKGGNPFGIEAGKSRPEIIAFAQNRQPGKASLESVQDQMLPQSPTVEDRQPHSRSWWAI